MSLIGNIQTLFSDKAKTTPVFPRTKVKAVSDDNGVGLNALLQMIDDKFAGTWIEYIDENGNPTDEPYLHYAVDENGNPVTTGLSFAEDGEF